MSLQALRAPWRGGKIKKMNWVDEHIVNPRSGRPEPHPDWSAVVLVNWAIWVLAVALAAGTIVYSIELGASQIAVLVGGCVILPLIGYFRARDLGRKRESLQQAVRMYENSLDRWPSQNGN